MNIFDGKLCFTIPDHLPLDEAAPPVGTVFIIGREPINPGTEHYAYFHGIHRKPGGPNVIVWNGLKTHGMPFVRADLLSVYSRFLARLDDQHSFYCLTRPARNSELTGPHPHWWGNEKLVKGREPKTDLDAFAKSILERMASRI